MKLNFTLSIKSTYPAIANVPTQQKTYAAWLSI